jgi:LysR family carnitine catabolism transcriptional activator
MASNNIKYRQLRGFADLAETGSFKSAADRLSVTQPSLTTLIKELESDLGVTLVDRGPGSARFSEAGSEFYEQIKGSLGQIEKAYLFAKAAGKGEYGRLRIATLPTLAASLLAPAIAQFHAQRPGVRIELIERSYYHFLRAVRQGEVDLGVGTMRSDESELCFERMVEDRLVIVAPLGHPLTRKDADLGSLALYELILAWPGHLPGEFNALGETFSAPAVQVEHPATALAMVRRGMGVTLTSANALVGVNTRGLACIPIPGRRGLRSVGMVTRTDAKPSAVATTFSKVLHQVLQNTMDELALSN